MTKYRIVYGPRAGAMKYVVQRRWLFFWSDVQGHDWIGWRDTLEGAQTLLAQMRLEDETDKVVETVVEP